MYCVWTMGKSKIDDKNNTILKFTDKFLKI